jgi:hypothetical protein
VRHHAAPSLSPRHDNGASFCSSRFASNRKTSKSRQNVTRADSQMHFGGGALWPCVLLCSLAPRAPKITWHISGPSVVFLGGHCFSSVGAETASRRKRPNNVLQGHRRFRRRRRVLRFGGHKSRNDALCHGHVFRRRRNR